MPFHIYIYIYIGHARLIFFEQSLVSTMLGPHFHNLKEKANKLQQHR
jgi:hypothetical protein